MTDEDVDLQHELDVLREQDLNQTADPAIFAALHTDEDLPAANEPISTGKDSLSLPVASTNVTSSTSLNDEPIDSFAVLLDDEDVEDLDADSSRLNAASSNLTLGDAPLGSLHSGESDNVTEMSESQALHTEALSVYSSANGTFTDAALPEDSLRSPYDASAEEEPDWWGLEDQGVTDYTGVGEISFNTSRFKVASAGSADSLAGLNDAALLNGGLLGQEQSHLEASSDLSTVQASDLNASQQHQRVSTENKSALGKPSKLASLQGLASGAFDSVVHSAAFRSLSGAVNRSKPDPIKDPEDSVSRISDILDAAEEDEGDLDVEPDHDEL